MATAHRINPDYGIGDIVAEEVTPRNFGRLAAQAAKQIVVQKIREAERDSIYDDYQDKENDIVTGTVQRVDENGNISSTVPFNDGYCYFTPDNKKFYIDWLDESKG